MTNYESKSIGWWTFVLAGLLGLGGIWMMLEVGRTEQGALLTGAVFFVLALVLANFGVLTVRVSSDAVSWRFGPVPIGRRIELRHVLQVEPRRTPWYWGWGVRWTKSGWLWRAHGLDAVWLQLDDGKWIGVGTQDPSGLARAVRQRVQYAGVPQGD